MRIPLLVDIEAVTEDDPQIEGKRDDILQEMEFHVADSLRLLGHEVPVVAFGPDITTTIEELKSLKPDLVFNLTEHFRGDRRRDAHIAALLELLDIPYTGSGPEGLMLCRDKAACKRILGYHRIRVPRFQALRPGHTRLSAKVPYPVIVKPVYEDGSDGIALASLVHNANDLEERVRMIHERMQQPAICEEFIEGREVYVAIIGNKRLQTLPAREVLFGKADTGGPQFATSRVKLDDEYREKWGIEYAHADLPDRLEEKASYSAKRIYRLLHIRDYGRIDMRITAEGRIVFLEANPNPELTMGDEVAASAERVGIDHVKLIERIMKRAVARYKR